MLPMRFELMISRLLSERLSQLGQGSCSTAVAGERSCAGKNDKFTIYRVYPLCQWVSGYLEEALGHCYSTQGCNNSHVLATYQEVHALICSPYIVMLKHHMDITCAVYILMLHAQFMSCPLLQWNLQMSTFVAPAFSIYRSCKPA